MAFPFGPNERWESSPLTSAWQRAFSWFGEDRRAYFRNLGKKRGRSGGHSGLRMEALEPRLLLSADAMPFLIDMTGADGSDFSLRYDALTLSIQVYDQESSTLVSQRALNEISFIRVIGTEFDDNLTLDFSAGFFSPVDIEFYGGLGADVLSITGAALDNVSLSVVGDGEGTLELALGADMVGVTVQGVEAVTDTTTAATRVFADRTGTGQTLRLQDAGTAGDGISTITGNGGLIEYTFQAPGTLLTVDTGAGDDIVAYDGIDPALLGKVLINGGAGSDAITGPPANTTWNITGANAGDVAGVSFV